VTSSLALRGLHADHLGVLFARELPISSALRKFACIAKADAIGRSGDW
jgi:hypothetical protein